MKICLFVPDGVGIKNYLYSSIVPKLISNGHEVILWHRLSPKVIKEVNDLHGFKLDSVSIPKYREGVWEKFYREAAALARLRYNSKIRKNRTILSNNWKHRERRWSKKFFYRLIALYVFFYGKTYDQVLKIEEKHSKFLNQSKFLDGFRKVIKDVNPDLLFCTHQRAILAIPAVKASNLEGVRSVTAVYSWDNLPKARMPIRTDQYLVWSDYMLNELSIYYPEIDLNQVKVVGTPQFEFYKEGATVSRSLFCKEFGLDENKKIICFSGDDLRTSPYDPDYLKDIASAILEIPEKNRPQILLRRCPVDFSERFKKVVKEFPEIIKVSEPLWSFEGSSKDWSLIYPKHEDVKLLVNVAAHCEAVINVGSTMAHDFSIFNKPAIYISYDQPYALGWSTEVIYQLEHFQSMEGLDPVVWLHSKGDLVKVIGDVLNHPNKVAKDRGKWFNRIMSVDLSEASSEIVQVLVGEYHEAFQKGQSEILD